MKEWLDCCMDICSSYRIRQWYWTWKAFLSIKNYFYQHQNITIIIKGESETCPSFWNRHNNSLSKVYRFIWSCHVFFYYWACFSRLAGLLSSSRSLCYLPYFAPTASSRVGHNSMLLIAYYANNCNGAQIFCCHIAAKEKRVREILEISLLKWYPCSLLPWSFASFADILLIARRYYVNFKSHTEDLRRNLN